MGAGRITLADVAAAAGVSKMTASRALRGAGDVSAATVEKVRRAAEDIGYMGNSLAMALSSQRTNLIGVVVPSLTNVVFAEVLSGVTDGLRGSGLQAVFGVSDYDPAQEYDAIRAMLSWRPAGLIVTGLDQSAAIRALLENAEVPVVQIMDLDGEAVDGCVGFSQRQAGADMAGALLNEGRRRFAYVGCGLARDTRAAKRRAGFEQALPGGFATVALDDGPSTVEAGRRLTAETLEQHPDIDAIYYSNDDVAMGGLFHCLSHGIAVPGSVRLAGFNGLEMVDSLPARLATSRTQRRRIGEVAARMVLSPETPRRVVLRPELVL